MYFQGYMQSSVVVPAAEKENFITLDVALQETFASNKCQKRCLSTIYTYFLPLREKVLFEYISVKWKSTITNTEPFAN